MKIHLYLISKTVWHSLSLWAKLFIAVPMSNTLYSSNKYPVNGQDNLIRKQYEITIYKEPKVLKSSNC